MSIKKPVYRFFNKLAYVKKLKKDDLDLILVVINKLMKIIYY